MNKQVIEFELLDGGREKPTVQQQSYPRWPHPVNGCDQATCEFQYRAFRDAYNKLARDIDGNLLSYGLTDAELRVCWLEYYDEFKQPSQRKLEIYANEVCNAGRNPLSGMSSNDKSLICMIAAFALILMLLL